MTGTPVEARAAWMPGIPRLWASGRLSRHCPLERARLAPLPPWEPSTAPELRLPCAAPLHQPRAPEAAPLEPPSAVQVRASPFHRPGGGRGAQARASGVSTKSVDRARRGSSLREHLPVSRGSNRSDHRTSCSNSRPEAASLPSAPISTNFVDASRALLHHLSVAPQSSEGLKSKLRGSTRPPSEDRWHVDGSPKKSLCATRDAPHGPAYTSRGMK
jgi:hypothetical protein